VREYRSCDVDKACQRVLLSRGCEHVVGSTWKLLPPRGLAQVRQLFPGLAGVGAGTSYELVDKYMRRRKALLFPSTATTRGCLRHPGQSCPLYPRSGVTFALAGPNCQPWCKGGLRQGKADARSLPFLVYKAEQQAGNNDFVGLEQSDRFPIASWTEALSGRYQTITLCGGPEDIGWPIARRRWLAFSLGRDWVWTGPAPADVAAAFVAFAGAAVVADGDVFVFDDTGDVEVYDQLAPGGKRIFDAYFEDYLAQPAGSGAFVVDLSQTMKRRAAGAWLSTLTTHGIKYSISRSHLFTPRELWFAHGWPSAPAITSGRAMPNIFEQGFSQNTLQRLVGNGWHIAYTAAFFWWCLAQVVPRSAVETVERPIAAIAGAAGETCQPEGPITEREEEGG